MCLMKLNATKTLRVKSLNLHNNNMVYHKKVVILKYANHYNVVQFAIFNILRVTLFINAYLQINV